MPKHPPRATLRPWTGGIKSIARRESRWWLVHYAGCTECTPDHELRVGLVRDGIRDGASIPRSLRHLIPDALEYNAKET